jgi:uncharacterized protein with HEPN domain
MYNDLVIARLCYCLEHIETIERYFKDIKSPAQLSSFNNGLQFDAILMRLQALGENLKRISISHPAVINDLAYPEVKNVMRFRDYVSHHYEQLESEVVYDVCSTRIPQLKKHLIDLVNKHGPAK